MSIRQIVGYLVMIALVAFFGSPAASLFGKARKKAQLFVLEALWKAANEAHKKRRWAHVFLYMRLGRTLFSSVDKEHFLGREHEALHQLGYPGLAVREATYRQGLRMLDAERLNSVVNAFVSLGEYRKALRAASPTLEKASAENPSIEVEATRVLVEINRAEAEYNLGLWAEAAARMENPHNMCEASPICRAGSRLQRAWIYAHMDRARESLALCDETELSDLPEDYHAETYFCRGVALLALGEIDAAERAIKDGQTAARRFSSERNALFLLARVAARREHWDKAELLCRQASRHRWRYQGGEGLLLWGDVLTNLGRTNEARHAWQLARCRDPESESAATATRRLSSSG